MRLPSNLKLQISLNAIIIGLAMLLSGSLNAQNKLSPQLFKRDASSQPSYFITARPLDVLSIVQATGNMVTVADGLGVEYFKTSVNL